MLPPLIPLDAILAARERLRGMVLRTPVVPLRHDAALPDVWLGGRIVRRPFDTRVLTKILQGEVP